MDIEPVQILLQIVNFGLVLFILLKFLIKPVTKVLESRSEKIKEGMDAAEQNITERNKMEATVKAEIQKARKEAAKIVADAKKQADTEAAQIVAAAKEQAKKAADNERAAFESMLTESRAKAQQELKQLVAATTAEVLKNGLTPTDQQRIIDSQVKLLKEVKFT